MRSFERILYIMLLLMYDRMRSSLENVIVNTCENALFSWECICAHSLENAILNICENVIVNICWNVIVNICENVILNICENAIVRILSRLRSFRQVLSLFLCVHVCVCT